MTLINKKYYFLISLILIFIIITVIAFFINFYQVSYNDTNYVLKTYKNTVALYNGDKIIKIYNDIVLNTLPQSDIQSFNNGITFETQEYAEKHLEDFDS